MKYRYGWRRDLPDHRDHLYSAPIEHLTALPSSVDLRPQCPPVYDQGQLGSCTANAIAAAIEFDRLKQGLSDIMPSRLFIYYFTRKLEGTVSVDAGATLRDTTKTVAKLGACSESEWPYDISRFAVKPSTQASKDALSDRALSYQRVARNLSQMETCLASGYPFAFGATIYESFETDIVAQTGIVPLPGQDEQILGGHALLAVGYDTSKRWFIIRNSWGTSFGDQGYIYMPFEYLLNQGLATDFWVIKTVG